jgi:hypothetical protein
MADHVAIIYDVSGSVRDMQAIQHANKAVSDLILDGDISETSMWTLERKEMSSQSLVEAGNSIATIRFSEPRSDDVSSLYTHLVDRITGNVTGEVRRILTAALPQAIPGNFRGGWTYLNLGKYQAAKLLEDRNLEPPWYFIIISDFAHDQGGKWAAHVQQYEIKFESDYTTELKYAICYRREGSASQEAPLQIKIYRVAPVGFVEVQPPAEETLVDSSSLINTETNGGDTKNPLLKFLLYLIVAIIAGYVIYAVAKRYIGRK